MSDAIEALPPEGEEMDAEPLDASDVLKAAHEALELAYGDEAIKAAFVTSPKIALEFGDDGSVTITVGDASKVVTADELDAALAGDEPTDIPDPE